MPQLDIQTYLSTVTYVMVLFLGLVFFVYYIIVPKLSERLKARNLLETKVILPEGENETLNRITEEHKVISLLIEKKKDTLLQSGHIILGISVKTTLIYLTLYLMLAALLINPELIVISGFFIVFIIILVNLAKNLNTWLLEIIKQQENKGVAIFTEQVQQTKTSLNNVEREMRLIHQIPRLTVSFTEVLEEKMICETNEITAHIARNLKDILEKSLRMERAFMLQHIFESGQRFAEELMQRVKQEEERLALIEKLQDPTLRWLLGWGEKPNGLDRETPDPTERVTIVITMDDWKD